MGLLLGVSCGLLLGEYCRPLQGIGNAYVKLLQMTVLPYLILSLVAKLGRLNANQARGVGLATLGVLLSFWTLAIALIVLVSAIFPEIEGAAFYSPAAELETVQVDLVSLFIPSNVFQALSQEYVPAIVVFCLFFGGAMISVPGKEKLLDLLDLCAAGMAHANLVLVRLAPIGLFTLTAAAAGTLGLDELSRLQAYLILFSLICAAATFGVLPLLLTSVCPIRYRTLIGAAQGPWLTVLATGKLFVALPQIIEACDSVLQNRDGEPHACEVESRPNRSDSTELGDKPNRSIPASVIVPLAYPFPHMGKVFAFLFISFAAWYSGQRLSPGETLTMASTGTASSFASPLVTLPFLLDRYQLPQDLMSLFIVPGFVTMRLADVVGVMHLMVLTLIVNQAMRRKLQVRWARLAISAVGFSICMLFAGAGTRMYLASVELDYQLDDRLLALEILEPHDDVLVFESRTGLPPPSTPQVSTLERLKRDKVLRVGYHRDHLPYTFFNAKNHLVGFDIELVHRLAKQLSVRVKFVPYSHDSVLDQLGSGEIDLAVGGLVMVPERLLVAGFTQPYQTATASVAMRDHRRGEFKYWEDFGSHAAIHLGAVHQDVVASARQEMPNADIVVIDSLREFFSGSAKRLDGVVVAAEEGAAWNVLYPRYTIVVPKPIVRRPVSMAVRSNDTDWLAFLNRWLDFEKLDGSITRMQDYWVAGGGAQQRSQRWCVMRDVLHWLP